MAICQWAISTDSQVGSTKIFSLSAAGSRSSSKSWPARITVAERRLGGRCELSQPRAESGSPNPRLQRTPSAPLSRQPLGATGMNPSIKASRRAAERLLERWFADEASLHEALRGRTPIEQREALGRAATYFGVARSLKRLPEDQLGLPRFELLRRCFAEVKPSKVSDRRVAAVTVGVAEAVARAYGGTLYLSLATKLLWAKYRDPFVIYDSVVRKYLGTSHGDYSGYLQAWHSAYSVHCGAIATACAQLSKERSANSAAQRILAEDWFRRRTLDLVIWHGGA